MECPEAKIDEIKAIIKSAYAKRNEFGTKYFFAIVNSCFLENFYLSNVQLGNLFVLIGLTYFYVFIKNNYHRKWLFLSALFLIG